MNFARAYINYDGHRAGAATLNIFDHLQPPRTVIATLFIKPEYRGLGLGTKLLNRCITKSVGDWIFVKVDKGRASGFSLRKWYKRHGFKGYVGYDNDILILDKRIATSTTWTT